MLGLRRPRETEYIPRSDVQKDRAISDLEERVARLEQQLAGLVAVPALVWSGPDSVKTCSCKPGEACGNAACPLLPTFT